MLTGFVDADGETEIVDIGVNAEFDGSTITGSSGCNRYNASYEATGNQIAFSPIASMRFGLRRAGDERRDQIPRAPGRVASYEVEGPSMSMSDADGPMLRFTRA